MRVVARGIGRPFLLLTVLAVIGSCHVAEAGIFDGLMSSMMGKVTSTIENVMQETKKKISVLSGVFGEGVTRGDLSLPEIINGAFSRNNGIFVGDKETDKDWKLGDGKSVLGAASTDGIVGVISNGGNVTILSSTPVPEVGPKPPTEDEKSGGESGVGKEEVEDAEGDDKELEPAASNEAETEEEEEEELTMDEKYMELMSDWDAFVTSSIWDVQEGESNREGVSADGEESLQGNASSRVVNGVFFQNRVPSGSSFAVKFFYNDEENFYCSGSLIGYSYVLTAAHCGVVVGDQVRVGGRLLRSGYKATVAEVMLHPEFEAGTLIHDVAVVRVAGLPGKRKLKGNGVKAARLNRRAHFPRGGFVGVVSGHGSSRTDGRGVSDGLVTTRQTVYGLDKCAREITQGRLQRDRSFVCGGDGGRSTTCVGDSGAGLWRVRTRARKHGKRPRAWFEVFAVVSFGEVTDDALCPRGPPTVFQRTASSYDWIRHVVGADNMA